MVFNLQCSFELYRLFDTDLIWFYDELLTSVEFQPFRLHDIPTVSSFCPLYKHAIYMDTIRMFNVVYQCSFNTTVNIAFAFRSGSYSHCHIHRCMWNIHTDTRTHICTLNTHSAIETEPLSNDDKFELLQASPLQQFLPLDDISDLVHLFETHRYSVGDVLYKQFDSSERLYVIGDGRGKRTV